MNTKKIFSEADLSQIVERLDELKLQFRKQGKKKKEKFVDNYDFIKLFNISLRTSKNWRDSHRIPYSRVGRKIYFRLKDIERLLEENRVE